MLFGIIILLLILVYVFKDDKCPECKSKKTLRTYRNGDFYETCFGKEYHCLHCGKIFNENEIVNGS